MLMAAATHIVGSAHSSSISPPPPWHPVVLVPNHHHHQQVLYDDLDLATPSPFPFPSPTTPAATASSPRHNHLRPVSRRAGKQPRRPRPSRKLPTTYIRTDAASFRRMVHQVTGADDVLPLHLHGPAAAPGPELLCRQAPAPHSRAGLTLTTTKTDTLLLPPTLDTSAFLMLGAAAGGGRGRGRGGAAPARPPGVSCYHGSSVVVDPGVAVQVKTEEASGGGGDGFPSLESWDEDDALF